MITLQILPGIGDIFYYKLYDAFVSVKGIMRLLLSAAFFVSAFVLYGETDILLILVLVAFGSMNVIVSPVMFYFQAKKTAEKQGFISFRFSLEGIVVADRKSTSRLEWSSLALTVWCRKQLFLYITPRQAFVLPIRQMDGHQAELLELTQKMADPNRFVKRHLF